MPHPRFLRGATSFRWESSSRLRTTGVVILPEAGLRLCCLLLWQFDAEVRVGVARRHAAARRALQEADLHQVRLVDVHERVGLLRDRGGDRLDADRATVVLLDD